MCGGGGGTEVKLVGHTCDDHHQSLVFRQKLLVFQIKFESPKRNICKQS